MILQNQDSNLLIRMSVELDDGKELLTASGVTGPNATNYTILDC
jgi:hypothetical protein